MKKPRSKKGAAAGILKHTSTIQDLTDEQSLESALGCLMDTKKGELETEKKPKRCRGN